MWHIGVAHMGKQAHAGRTQAALAGVAGITLCFSAYGVVHAAAGAVQMTGALGTPQSPEAKLDALRHELASMHVKVDRIKHAAEVHAAHTRHAAHSWWHHTFHYQMISLMCG